MVLTGARPPARGLGVAIAALLLGACSTASEGTDPAGPGRATATSTAPAASSSASPSPSPSRSPSDGASEAPAAMPAYAASVRRIGPRLRDRMRPSHRAGCPVPLSDLRYLRMSHLGFDGEVRTGEMVVHEDHARGVADVFRRLYDARWPIRRMRLVDAYGGDDDRSMAANNTSGYNCRRVGGSTSWSQHAYGTAIDLNPVQNPYVTAGSVAPPAGRRFAAIDRSPGARVPAGAVGAGDLPVRAFADIGWRWGGRWSSSKDYQHFSATGR